MMTAHRHLTQSSLCATAPLRLIAAILISFVSLTACAAPPRSDVHSIGVALDMLIEQDDSAALYRVAADGTVAFAGGYDARMRRFTWTGELAAGEIDHLRAIFRSPFWNEPRRDAGRPESGERRTTITVHQPMRNRIIIRGEQPEDVAALESLLKSAAARRFEREIDALPKPGPQR